MTPEERMDRLEGIVAANAIAITEMRESMQQGFAETREQIAQLRLSQEQGFAESREQLRENAQYLVALVGDLAEQAQQDREQAQRDGRRPLLWSIAKQCTKQLMQLERCKQRYAGYRWKIKGFYGIYLARKVNGRIFVQLGVLAMRNPQELQNAISAANNAHTGLHQAIHELRHGSPETAKLMIARQIAVLANVLTRL